MIRGACIAACVLFAPALAQDEGDDPFVVVEQYLADLGLDELRAEYLEDQLDAMGGADRVSVARRLAELYARMLRDAPDDAARSRLESKAEALLEAIPQVESDELRLSLARANFERAESVLERWRLRAVPQSEALGAIRSMKELAQTFDRIGRESHSRIERLESREERARDSDLPMIEARIDESLQRRSTSFYLAGWAHRYGAEFDFDRESATRSRIAFGWLLNAGVGDEPQLDRVPEGYERLPHVALAMLSVSFTHAQAKRRAIADRWYDRVAEADDLAPEVRDQLVTRRLIALCAMEAWADAKRLLDGLDADDPRAVLTARLASVLASVELEQRPDDRDAQALRDAGFAALVARGELGQAVEIVESFGLGTLRTTGFVGGLVRGVVEYQRLRGSHRESGDANKPAQTPALVQRYRAVGDTLLAALNQPDATTYPQARAGGSFVLGMCRYYAGDFEPASALFQTAAEDGAGTPTEPDALWMAIIALDALGVDAPSRDMLIDRFLDRYPDHPRASRLAMRRAMEREDDPERSIALLLEIGPEEASYESARRQAARLAYRQAVEASSPLAASRGRRFLDIAEPLLALDRRNAESDAAAAERAATNARRILGVALRLDTPDIARATRAFDAIASMAERGLVSTLEFQGELLFRRAELALAMDDVEQAEAMLEELQTVDPDLAAQGDRLIWRDAIRAWTRARDRGDDERLEPAAKRVVRIGERLVEELGTPESALADDANASVYRSVARAGADVWRLAFEDDARALSQRLFGALIEHGAESRDTLEGFVAMARAGGEFAKALDAQRRLVAGLEAGSRAWFGARTLQLEILVEVDRIRARDALRQHAALYPDLAPEPWKTRLRMLADRLNVSMAVPE